MMRHTKRCRDIKPHCQPVLTKDGDTLVMTWQTCVTCGAWLPLGPSDETSVAVEVRAAELAGMTGPERFSPRFYNPEAIEHDEMAGWDACILVIERPHHDENAYHAGYLARVIYDHGKSQRG